MHARSEASAGSHGRVNTNNLTKHNQDFLRCLTATDAEHFSKTYFVEATRTKIKDEHRVASSSPVRMPHLRSSTVSFYYCTPPVIPSFIAVH